MKNFMPLANLNFTGGNYLIIFLMDDFFFREIKTELSCIYLVS